MCTVSTQYGNIKIGIREFRENLAGYLESGKPLAITRHGETLGFYGSAQQSVRKPNLRGFLESEVFALEACPMAPSHQNGRNP